MHIRSSNARLFVGKVQNDPKSNESSGACLARILENFDRI